MTDREQSNSVVVLIVEDEVLIRLSVVDALEDAGFQVFEANHAEEAVAILQEGASRFHILFTDVHMPGPRNGLELAHHVRKRWPSIALLLTSGKATLAASELPEGSRFLAKPYNPREVIRHIRELAQAA